MKYTLGKNYTELQVERIEDLAILYMVIEEGDLIYSWTAREVRGRGGERLGRERVYLGIRVKSVEFHEPRGVLRIRGIIVDYPDWLEGAGGSYHSLDVGPGSAIKVMRRIDEEYLKLLIGTFSSSVKALIVSFSVEETAIALVDRNGVEEVSIIQNKYVNNKEEGGSLVSQRYVEEVSKRVREIFEAGKPTVIIVASPGMLRPFTPRLDQLNASVKYVEVTEGGLAGVYEVERSGVLDEVGLMLGSKYVSRVMEELSRSEGKVALGAEVDEAFKLGAVQVLLISSRYMFENLTRVKNLVSQVIKTRASLVIIPSGTEPGKILEGLGGVAALLRFSLR